MNTFYLIIVGVLFVLAISDLVVGVSNDAVNFLNSAIGAKAATFRVIMIIAAIGIFVGATFSSGMMEVARKGIFNPQNFYFSEIMIIFLAVMLTDIILLDGFNTLGMPTSTTVSIVFELLGAAVAISIIKIARDPNSLPMYEYINTAKATAIISGILLSVVVAFTTGLVVQWISRLIFSFSYEKKIKYYGSIFGGLAIAAITYFMLIKGVKGAVFMTKEAKDWISHNSWLILGISFAGWTIVLQLLYWLFKINILKIIVLVGTFALAMAFAGNDLVNFIGVPLAGLQSYKEFVANPGIDPDHLTMGVLAGKVKTQPYLLAIAGLVMVITLWTSKKAKNVVKTSVDLARQSEGEERFGSSSLARSVVRVSRNMSNGFCKVLPESIQKKIDKQFDHSSYQEKISKEENPPAFDMIRASVNLVVASILIALATSLKLPLSTTYVTFMVAMGSSLADRAWGRESAVYRVTGVMSVVGGWFLTAFIAFTAAFILANIIYWGGAVAIVLLCLTAIYLIYRTKRTYQKRLEKEAEELEIISTVSEDELIINACMEKVAESIHLTKETFINSVRATIDEDVRTLRKTERNCQAHLQDVEQVKVKIYFRLPGVKKHSDDLDVALYQMTDFLWEEALALERFIIPLHKHIENNHKTFTKSQQEELKPLNQSLTQYFNLVTDLVENNKFELFDKVTTSHTELQEAIRKIRKTQLKRLKTEKGGTRISLLYSDMLHEANSINNYILGLVKAYTTFSKGYNN